MAWAFAKLEYHAGEVLDAALAALVSHPARFNDKAVSNVLWALTSTRHPLRNAAHDLGAVAVGLQVGGAVGCSLRPRSALVEWGVPTEASRG